MKHEVKSGPSRSALAVKSALSGIALSALLGLSMNAQAQTCTTDNWDMETGTALAAGTQSPSNRRYGGPCGLRVALDGTTSFLTDMSPTGEASYIVRFYAYLDATGTEDLILYEADDGTDPQIQVWKNVPEDGDLTLNVFDQGGGNTFLTVEEANVGNGWKAIEFVWEASSAADNIVFSVSDRFGASEVVGSIDTTGLTIARAHLGNVNSAGGGGTLDVDDYDSRRVSRPGRLCRGDTNDDEEIRLADVNNVFTEVQTFGSTLAGGQPDYDENGSVGLSDVNLVFNQVQAFDFDCPTP